MRQEGAGTGMSVRNSYINNETKPWAQALAHGQSAMQVQTAAATGWADCSAPGGGATGSGAGAWSNNESSTVVASTTRLLPSPPLGLPPTDGFRGATTLGRPTAGAAAGDGAQ